MLRSVWLVVVPVVLLAGCPAVFDLTALDDVTVGNDLAVGGEINADSGEIGGVEIDEGGNVSIPGNLVVEGDIEVIGDIGLGGEIEDLPEPPLPPPPPPADDDGDGQASDELKVILLPPFLGLAIEGEAPTTCQILVVGNFQVEVKIKVAGGRGPYSSQFRNYYGSFTDQTGAGSEFTFRFDAVVPTTKCVSSQLRVIDATGQAQDIFFYVKVN